MIYGVDGNNLKIYDPFLYKENLIHQLVKGKRMSMEIRLFVVLLILKIMQIIKDFFVINIIK